jgi:hypothetical protein
MGYGLCYRSWRLEYTRDTCGLRGTEFKLYTASITQDTVLTVEHLVHGTLRILTNALLGRGIPPGALHTGRISFSDTLLSVELEANKTTGDLL